MHHKNLFKGNLSVREMNKWFELFLGLVLLVFAILVGWASDAYTWTIFGKDLNFLHSAWVFLKGAVFWFVVMVASLLIVLGVNDLRE